MIQDVECRMKPEHVYSTGGSPQNLNDTIKVGISELVSSSEPEKAEEIPIREET